MFFCMYNEYTIYVCTNSPDVAVVVGISVVVTGPVVAVKSHTHRGLVCINIPEHTNYLNNCFGQIGICICIFYIKTTNVKAKTSVLRCV